MLRSYYRYDLLRRFGILTDPNTPVYYLGDTPQIILSCSKFHLSLTNARTQECVGRIFLPSPGSSSSPSSPSSHQHRHPGISTFCVTDDSQLIAVGTLDGYVFLFSRSSSVDEEDEELESESSPGGPSASSTSSLSGLRYDFRMKSRGHKHAISAMCFGPWRNSRSGSGTRNSIGEIYLATGGRDSDIVLWDTFQFCPLYRLRGHKNEITSLQFVPPRSSGSSGSGSDEGTTETENILISGSKDGLLKVWELGTRRCVQTLKPEGIHREVWEVALIRGRNENEVVGGGGGSSSSRPVLLVGGNEPGVHCWDMTEMCGGGGGAGDSGEAAVEGGPVGALRPIKKVYERRMKFVGKIMRRSERRVRGISWTESGTAAGDFVLIHSDDVFVEVFKRRRASEMTKRRDKACEEFRRQRRGVGGGGGGSAAAAGARADDEEDESEPQGSAGRIEDEVAQFRELWAQFEFAPVQDLRLTSRTRIRTARFFCGEGASRMPPRVLVGTLSNTIEEWVLQQSEWVRTAVFDKHGHGRPVSSLSLASTGVFLASLATGNCRLWNVESGRCVRSLEMPSPSASCCAFLPGNQHVAIGTKRGEILLFDVNAAVCVDAIKTAHQGEVNSLIVRPDKNGIVSCSSDKTVVFWNFVMKSHRTTQARHLGLDLVHTLQMSDEIMSVCISAKATYIALCLLDNTVKVFYLNTLKFYLSLYGHHLPVLAVDISDDEFMCASVSADKNIKLWSLQFGNCMKSIFAHNAAITGVKFVPKTHHFFTISHDGALKRWDGDRYECIQILQREDGFAPLLSLDVRGNFVVASGEDRCLRVYRESDDLVFLTEEKEQRMEEEYEQELVHSQEFGGSGSAELESGQGGHRTMETIRFGDELIAALDLLIAEEKKVAEYDAAVANGRKLDAPVKNPRLLNLSHSQYLWRALEKIRMSDVESILSVIPYRYAVYLLKCFAKMFRENAVSSIELASRIVTLLVRIHERTLSRDSQLFQPLQFLHMAIKTRLTAEKHNVGLNLVAIGYVKKRLDSERLLRDVNEALQEDLAAQGRKRKRDSSTDVDETERLKKKLRLL